MNITHLIFEQYQRHPYKKAVIFPHKKHDSKTTLYSHYTYKQLHDQSNALAYNLQQMGIAKDTKILLFIKPSLHFSLVTFTLFKIGAIPIFIDPGMGLKNLIRSIKEVSPHALIGVPKVHFLRLLFPKAFSNISLFISTGGFPLPFTTSLNTLLNNSSHFTNDFPIADTKAHDKAAIIYTSGATGKAKGVVYTHQMFHTQVLQLKQLFSYHEHDRDLPGFPLFSLMTIAMGVTSVIPDMDPSQPAQADPSSLIKTILDQGVTTVAGSPAIWEKVAHYCTKHKIKLPSIKAVIMFGAPVQSHLHQLFQTILPNGTTYTPYGATECLPITLISGNELLSSKKKLIKPGHGVCVGKVIPKTTVRIIKESITPYTHITHCPSLQPFEIGEIIVNGQQASRHYYNLENETKHAKILDQNDFWHRMGDLGYLDDNNYLWFCGRKAHKVSHHQHNYYSVPIESIFNQHKHIKRTALIAIKRQDDQTEPCLAVELQESRYPLSQRNRMDLKNELMTLAQQYSVTKNMTTFFIHPNFPVDNRHNIKIDRLKLAHHFQYRLKEAL